jgi:hypothetical protein
MCCTSLKYTCFCACGHMWLLQGNMSGRSMIEMQGLLRRVDAPHAPYHSSVLVPCLREWSGYFYLSLLHGRVNNYFCSLFIENVPSFNAHYNTTAASFFNRHRSHGYYGRGNVVATSRYIWSKGHEWENTTEFLTEILLWFCKGKANAMSTYVTKQQTMKTFGRIQV